MQDERLVPNKTPRRFKSMLQVTLLTLNLTLSSFYFGYVIKYFSTIPLLTLIRLVYVTDMGESLANGLTNGCISFGALFGALLSSILISKLSRKNVLLAVNAVAFTAGSLIFIQNFILLLAMRLVQGLCVGVYSAVIPMIVKELVPTEVSGTLGSLTQFSIGFGVFFAGIFEFVLAKIFDNPLGDQIFQVVFAFPLLTIAIQTSLLLFVFNFETPKYLLEKGKEEEARKIVQYLYLPEFVDDVMEEKKKDLSALLAPKNQEDKEEKEGSVLTERPNHSRKAPSITTVIAIHLAVLQQFSGINAVVTYGSDIVFKAYPDQADIIGTLINFMQVFAAFMTSFLLAKLGRKIILTMGSLAQGLSCVMVGIGCLLQGDQDNSFANLLVLVGLFLYMGVFGLTLGPLVWLYIPEVVQPNIIPYSTMANWSCAFLVTFLFPVVKDAVGNPGSIMLFFAVWCIASTIFNAKYLIETKDKSERQITQEYENVKIC